MRNNTQVKKKHDYVTMQEVLSINGSGMIIAFMCMVIFTIIPMNEEIARIILRWLSIILSFAASYLIYINTNYGIPKTQEKPTPKANLVALWLVNGFFIYLSAAGVNYLSNSRVSLGDNVNSISQNPIKHASIIPFLKDISWWPDAKLTKEIKRLNNELKIKHINKERSIDTSYKDTLLHLVAENIKLRKQSVDEHILNYSSLFILKVSTKDVKNEDLFATTIYLTDRPVGRLELTDYISAWTDDSGSAFFVLNRSLLKKKMLYLYCFYSDDSNNLIAEKKIPTASLNKKSNIFSFLVTLKADSKTK